MYWGWEDVETYFIDEMGISKAIKEERLKRKNKKYSGV